MALIYAGIGPRDTPDNIVNIMLTLGRNMAERGHTLRSGASGNADIAFERGCDGANGEKEIYLPWPGFGRRHGLDKGIKGWPSRAAQDFAAEMHPAWDKCDRDARLFLSRNMNILRGWHFEKHCDLLITWQHEGKTSGGTLFTVNVAKALKIPVFDLADTKSFDALENFPGI